MNIRQAILAAANHIERNPHEFQFHTYESPSGPSCGSPGCAIGWIGCFLGVKAKTGNNEIARRLGFIDTGPFYYRMSEFSDYSRADYISWMHSAAVCAKHMRLYADRWHPAQPIPDAVLAIFSMSPEQLQRELS